MATIRTTTTSDTDALGYDGPVEQRLRAMAEDAVAGQNEAEVHAEAAVLRARLGLQPQVIPASPHRIVCAIEDLPAEIIEALQQPLPDDPEARALDHLLDEDPGEWSPEAQRLLGEEDEPEALTP